MRRRVTSPRVLFLIAFLAIISLFFYNTLSYAEGLCEQQKTELDKYFCTHFRFLTIPRSHKAVITKLQTETRSLQEENQNLNKTLDQYTKLVVNLREQLAVDPRAPRPQEVIAVVIFTYNRPKYLQQTLESVLPKLPERNFPLFISQDGNNEEVTKVIKECPRAYHLHHSQRTPPVKKSPTERDSYYYISQHYQFALKILFEVFQYTAVIILEDDMEIAVDFFDYFSALLPVVRADPTLFCVSAWNDNGQEGYVKDPTKLYRSNFFPGLGWLMTRELWAEVSHKWPAGYWDDWLREPAQRKNRDCIRPEISRTYTFGEKGTSEGQFYLKYLKNIKLNDEYVDWKQQKLDYLYKSNYDVLLNEELQKATVINHPKEVSKYANETLLLYYSSKFEHIADQFGIMNDEKAGIVRTGYNGIVTFYYNNNKIFLAPAHKK